MNIEKVKRERAISILKEINIDRHYPFHDEALDLAITALESMQELERYRKTPLCGNCETRRTGMV